MPQPLWHGRDESGSLFPNAAYRLRLLKGLTVQDSGCLCLVTSDSLAGSQHLELLPGRPGLRIHAFLVEPSPRLSTLLAEEGIPASFLSTFPEPPHFHLPTHGANPVLQRSEHIRHALEILDSSHHFDWIEFADRGACGFRSIQARRTGLAFAETPMAVTLVGCSARMREQQGAGITDKEDLRTDFAEQYAFVHADLQRSTSSALLDRARGAGWCVCETKGDLVNSDAPSVSANASPLVSVVVTHFNLPDYLPEALESLAAQVYGNFEVLVVDDGSTCPRAKQVLEEQEHRYPRFRFLRGENAGAGAARNRGLAEAQGNYVLFFDADNVAFPELISTLVRGLERNPDVAALTSYTLGIGDDPDPRCRPLRFVNSFAGGPHVLACLENVYGDTTALFRTCALRSVGGYESDRNTPWEDWLTYIRLVQAGYQVEVAPAFLYHYRVRDEGRTARMVQTPADRKRHTQHLLQRYFSGPTLPAGVSAATLWQVMVRFGQLSDQHNTVRHRLADWLNNGLLRWPWLHGRIKRLLPRLRNEKDLETH